MKVAKVQDIFLIICCIIVQITVEPVLCILSYENNNFVKIKQDPTGYQLAPAFRTKKLDSTRNSNVSTPRENTIIDVLRTARNTPVGTNRNYSQNKNNNAYNNDKPVSQYKKWQVGRVSRKQYEIINMLWRKTKIFVDVDSTTGYHHMRSNGSERLIDSISVFRSPVVRPPRPSVSSTTPSFIEFYYLDETDDRLKDFPYKKLTQVPEHNREHRIRNDNHKFVLSKSHMFSFRIDDEAYKQTKTHTTDRYSQPTNRMKRRKTRTHDSSLTGFGSLNSLTPTYKFPRLQRPQLDINFDNLITTKSIGASEMKVMTNTTTPTVAISFTATNNTTTTNGSDNETCPMTMADNVKENENISSSLTKNIINTTQLKSTTVYDKIKFFEMYDKLTPVPYYDVNGKLIDADNIDILMERNDVNKNERKTLLEHVDQDISNEHSGPHKSKHAKKHIVETFKNDVNHQNNINSIPNCNKTSKSEILNVSNTNINMSSVTKQDFKQMLLSESKSSNLLEYTKSKHVDWDQYPFVAAYVYEPSQVHCDAAGISPHWLITSGSCLSRHHKNPGGEGRSAFVTYCGDSWWTPERLAYVKYSLVHPRFNARDKTRRHLYNIGLIQVVTSMAACSGWSSVSMMSHQFVANEEGSIANAVGWGLDRFDTRYSSNDLPKSPLMSYENEVFSDSCPGNVGYSKAKRLDEGGGVKNVYCLALPPYAGEDTDPTHGGLLFVGGKLVALYLQEERRPWGDQCAQYTGIWRLVPWVLDVARESDDVDTFTLDI